MAQLLLIRNANTPSKKVGDIIGVFEDTHKFSDREQDNYYIEKVAGFKTALELKQALPKPKVAVVYRSTAVWTLDRPEEKEVWQDGDGKWYDFVKSPKKLLNFYSLSIEERKTLADPRTALAERIILLQKCENRIKEYPENFTEVKDLNV